MGQSVSTIALSAHATAKAAVTRRNRRVAVGFMQLRAPAWMVGAQARRCQRAPELAGLLFRLEVDGGLVQVPAAFPVVVAGIIEQDRAAACRGSAGRLGRNQPLNHGDSRLEVGSRGRSGRALQE